MSEVPSAPTAAVPPGPSVTHGELNPDWYYTTANLGETAPGVLAPLSWSVWGAGAEYSIRYPFVQMGLLERSKGDIPHDPRDRFIQIVFGRAVASVTAFYEMGERMPGANGDMFARELLGEVPDGMRPNPTRRRYAHVAWNMPRAFARAKRLLQQQHAEIEAWWRSELRRNPQLDLAEARAQFLDATVKFRETTALQAQGSIVAIPPVFDALRSLAASTGMGDRMGDLTAGVGEHAETEVVIDLWDLGRGLLTEREFLDRHGFHGPFEGDIAGTVWREDPGPIRRMAELYAAQADDKDPRLTAAQRAHKREQAEAELLSRLGPAGRVKARIIIALAKSRIPIRGIGKASFLRTLDIARAAARRIGTLLVAEGLLEQVNDVMYLTCDELTARRLPDGTCALIADRRAQQALYRTLELPTAFWGEPRPIVAATAVCEEPVGELTGIGASAGVVEGVVRVVFDPSFAEVEPGEILVAATTDPSWASIMFVSAGLVVDIGGTLSHAAVVARELGVPCIVNTREGSKLLRTGDRVRIDGDAGTVSILERGIGEEREERQ